MLRSGSICASFLYNYLLSDSEYKDDKGSKLTKNANKLRVLSTTLSSYGGVLSKLSQLLCIGDEKNTVFSDCKPFSKEKTIAYFKDQFSDEGLQSNSNYKNVTDIDFEVFKSGSVGQVHRAKYKDKKMIFKVQYVGLAEQTLKDLNLLDKIASFIYYFTDMKEAMIDIKTKMYEELDYNLEAKNQILMGKFYKDSDYVHIPKIIPELSKENILAMQYVKGKGLSEFMIDSTQEEKNIAGKNIIKFIFTNIYKHSILYSDIHYGNFLIRKDNSISVLDFGCVHPISEKLTKNIKDLYVAVRDKDRPAFFRIVADIGIIKEGISDKSREYIYDYMQLQYEPWITPTEFQFTDKWFEKALEKDTDLMKEWVLPQEMVYFNKIPYCLIYILKKMKVSGSFKHIFDELL